MVQRLTNEKTLEQAERELAAASKKYKRNFVLGIVIFVLAIAAIDTIFYYALKHQ